MSANRENDQQAQNANVLKHTAVACIIDWGELANRTVGCQTKESEFARKSGQYRK